LGHHAHRPLGYDLGKLGRGPYRFVMTVVDAAGNRSPEARRAFLLPLGGGRSG
jgi:hypothetical protein